ncbi:MAG: hypothetical protein L3J43_02235 [Sulfurovum sp.]|nr:hypothetical protein [Sulfurovum sp.]
MRYYKIIYLVLISMVFVQAKEVNSNMADVLLTTELQGSGGNKEKAIDALVKKLDTIGYSTVSANKNIQVHYYNKFQEKNVEMLSFFSMVNKDKIRPLLLANPNFGAYAPFNFLVYKTLDRQNDDNTWYGHLDATTMLDIMGIADENNRKSFKSMVQSLDSMVNKEMTPALSKRFEHTKPLPTNGLTKLVMKFEKTDDLETFVEDFIADHDGRFAQHEFIIAGFIDFKFEYDDMDLDFDKYDAYWVSQLCHFKFSNAIFNRGIPEAGVFAPCSVYFYIPKGTNELHVGYASVDNWVNALNFRDQRRIDYMKAIDSEVVSIFEEMGFVRESQNTSSKKDMHTEVDTLKEELAKVKAELALLTKGKETKKVSIPKEKTIKKERTIEKEKQVSTAKIHKKTFKTAKYVIGTTAPKAMSAYYAAEAQDVENVKKKLESNGFKILSVIEPLEGHTVLSVTNKELQETNTFMAVLNMHIDLKNEIRVQNPSYLGAAYLQKNYKYGQFNQTLKSLQSVLGNLYEVKDAYDTESLGNFQFMMGMPYFDDTMEIIEGKNLETKVMGDKSKKYVAYTLKLPNGSMLVGHKLKKRTNAFLTKISAERNTNLLPYQSLIYQDKVVILDPKYYLALALPLLEMTDFMKIASAPGDIEKDIKRAYK